MLDIARHYETPSAVNALIDQASAYKMNVLHLHLSDDQGFRIAINGFPNLTAIGGEGSVGTGGRAMDPGGFWTQADYKAVVAYAAAHFMTRRPRGGHTRAQQRDHHVRVRRHGEPAAQRPPAGHQLQHQQPADVELHRRCRLQRDVPGQLRTPGRSSARSSTSSPRCRPARTTTWAATRCRVTVLSQDQYAALSARRPASSTPPGQDRDGLGRHLAGPGTQPARGVGRRVLETRLRFQLRHVTGTEAVAKDMKSSWRRRTTPTLTRSTRRCGGQYPADARLELGVQPWLRRRPVLQLGSGQLRRPASPTRT